MSKEIEYDVHFRDEPFTPITEEADKFARELLMPKEDFIKIAAGKKVSELAKIFQVDVKHVRTRAKELGFKLKKIQL